MDFVIEILKILSSFSPIAVIALLGVIILLLVKGAKKVDKIEGNDLFHIEDHLSKISETLQRIEVSLATLRGRINGRED